MDDTMGESVTPTDPSSKDPVASSALAGGPQNPQEVVATPIPQIPTKRPATKTTNDTGVENKELTKLFGVSTDVDWDNVSSLLPGCLDSTFNLYLLELVTITKMIK